MRICITGGPRTGKTTLSESIHAEQVAAWERPIVDLDGPLLLRTDDLIVRLAHLGKDAWSEASRVASEWLDGPGPWIIEGVAVCRALRKWRAAHPGEPPPVDKVIRLTEPHEDLMKGQAAMAKGEEAVWLEIEQWILQGGVPVEYK